MSNRTAFIVLAVVVLVLVLLLVACGEPAAEVGPSSTLAAPSSSASASTTTSTLPPSTTLAPTTAAPSTSQAPVPTAAPAPATTARPRPRPAPAPARPPAPAAPSSRLGVWDAIARCESGGNWNHPPVHNSAGTFSGGLMIGHAYWRINGGKAPAPYLASKAEQIAVAETIASKIGLDRGWQCWPLP